MLINWSIHDALVGRAAELANENRIEEAWFLTGVADALACVDPPMGKFNDENYGWWYRRGFYSIGDNEPANLEDTDEHTD